MLVPKLRFPGFIGEWSLMKLGDIAKLSKGTGVSKADINSDGDREAIRYGELYTTYGEVVTKIYSRIISKPSDRLSGVNDVLIPSSGETAIDISTATCVEKSGVAIGGDLNIIKTDESGRFLSYYFNHKKKIDIAKLAQGVSVVHLYGSDLKNLKINIPDKQEQQKIADFLTAVDERIELQSNKVEKLQTYKRGLVQKIFARTLRFKHDNGSSFPEWEEKHLFDVAIKMKSGGTPTATNRSYYDNGHIPFLAISDMTEQGKYLKWTSKFINQGGLDNSSSWLVPKDSLVYSMYASVGFVSIAKTDMAISQAVMAIVLRSGYDIDFIYYSLLNFKNFVHKYIETGTQGNLNAEIVRNIPLNIPCFEEQQKIGTLLSQIDEKITLETEKLEGLKKFKKSLLQRMFV